MHVLLRVDAKCLDGEQDTERRRLEPALGLEPTLAEPEADLPGLVADPHEPE